MVEHLLDVEGVIGSSPIPSTIVSQYMNVAIYLIIGLFAFTLYNVIVEQNIFKKLIFSSVMQSSIILYYIISVWSPAVMTPFYSSNDGIGMYVDPVPQVLMLTAIVVGFATTALGLAIVIRIKRKTGTIMYNEIEKLEAEDKD